MDVRVVSEPRFAGTGDAVRIPCPEDDTVFVVADPELAATQAGILKALALTAEAMARDDPGTDI